MNTAKNDDSDFPVCKYCGRRADEDIPSGWLLVLGKPNNAPNHWECYDCTPGRRKRKMDTP